MIRTHVERLKTLEEAKNKDILSVAEQLGMDLIRAGQSYYWKEHDSFVIDPRKNYFYWNAKQIGGNPIRLVEVIKDVTFKEAIDFLTTGNFTDKKEINVYKKKFHYFLKETDNIDEIQSYLMNERGLSKETVEFFYRQELLAQAPYKHYETNQIEKILVFKQKDHTGKIRSISLQGIKPYASHENRPYFKAIHGEGHYGWCVPIGNPPLKQGSRSAENPLKVIVFEAPIDLMSYYELFQHNLHDCLLIAMNGLKKSVISTTLFDYIRPDITDEALKPQLLDKFNHIFQSTPTIQLYLAVDNDKAGKEFIENFNIDIFPTQSHIPKLMEGKEKSDWNDCLKRIKEKKR